MKKMTITFAGICAIISLMVACNSPKAQEQEIPEPQAMNLVQRGEYLVTIMGCNDCHTPKIMTPHGPAFDPDRILSGHPASMPVMKFDTSTTNNWVLFNMNTTAMIGPWGASFAANLTSDDTGIGAWSEEQFKRALTEGKYKGLDGGRSLLPPMPWENYKDIKDEDLKAIFAYLKSTKPIENLVPAPMSPGDLTSYIR